MARVQGAQTRLYMKPETTYGTAPSGNYTQLGFIEADLGTGEPLLDNPIIGLGVTRDPGDPFLGGIDTAGSVTVPLNHEGFGHWLRLLFGAPTTTGSDPDYVHVFDSGALTLPSNAIEMDYGPALTTRFSMNTGVGAGDLAIEWSPTGPATARISLIAQGEVRGSVSGHGTPVAVSGTNFQRHQASISKGGSTLGQVVAANLAFSNTLEAVRTIRDDRKIEGADPGITALSGDIRLRLSPDAETLMSEAEASTPAEYDLRLQASAARYLNFNIPRGFLSSPRRPISGPAGVEVTFAFRAALDPTDGRMLRVTLANGVAGYA